jgi:hypothetical protein
VDHRWRVSGSAWTAYVVATSDFGRSGPVSWPAMPRKTIPGDGHTWSADDVFGPEIRQIFRDVTADRFRGRMMPPHARMLFEPEYGPITTDREFLSDFYNDILHQDTCDQHTAEGVPLVAALAVDDRVPPRDRMQLVRLLFRIATVSERHTADCWPGTHPNADAAGEARARAAVEEHAPTLLARWDTECLAVRLALAAVATVFPAPRTAAALIPRLRRLAERNPTDTPTGDYVRFAVVLATSDEPQILAAVESFTDYTSYWQSTARPVPTRARAFHLLDQMLSRVRLVMHAGKP